MKLRVILFVISLFVSLLLTSFSFGEGKIDPFIKIELDKRDMYRSSVPPTIIMTKRQVDADKLKSEIEKLKKNPPVRKITKEILNIRKDSSGREFISILTKRKTQNAESVIKSSGGRINSISGDIISADVPLNSIITLSQSGDFEYIQAGKIPRLALDLSLPAMKADQVQNTLNDTGKGVLVGNVDTGIDWKHGDFLTADGKSRILYLWDQTDDTGPHPAGYDYGTEYTKAQIDAALAGSGTVNENDAGDANVGHGTYTTGIAAGNGLASGKYKGMAPDADIIFVKMDQSSDTRLLDGDEYLVKKADTLGKPISINNSWGFMTGPHDGTSYESQFINNLIGAGKPGKCISVAAGNSGDLTAHSAGTAPYDSPGNLVLTIPYMMQGITYVEVWYKAEDRIQVGVGYMSGLDGSYTNLLCQPGTKINTYTVPEDALGIFSGAKIDIDATDTPFAPNPSLNHVLLQVDLTDTLFGGMPPFDWIISFQALKGTCNFDAYAISQIMSQFTTDDTGQMFFGDNEQGIASPADAQNVITVGACVSKNNWNDKNGLNHSFLDKIGSMCSFSCRGPLRDGSRKPDITAPGKMIASALSADYTGVDANYVTPDGRHQLNEGTSAACPHITGLAALMLAKNPNLDCQQIKNIITTTATKDSYTGTSEWDTQWGYGKANALNALNAIISDSITYTTSSVIHSGWNLISLPGEPVNGDPETVLNGLNPSSSSMSLWDNMTPGGGYLIYKINWNGPMKLGEAYWMIQSGVKEISYTGKINDVPERTIVIPAHQTAPYWAMIGYPMDHNVPCSSITFSTPTNPTPVSWQDAVQSKGWIEAPAQMFDSSTQGYVIAAPPITSAAKDYLEPWAGYWLLVKTNEELTITIPGN